MLNDRWTFVYLKSFLISFLGGHPLLLGLIIREHIHSTETMWNCRSTPLTLEACSRETANIIDCELWMSSAPTLLSTTLRTKLLSWWKLLWVMLQRLVHSLHSCDVWSTCLSFSHINCCDTVGLSWFSVCPQVNDTDMESLQDSVLQLVLSLLEDSMKREYFFQVSAFKIH